MPINETHDRLPKEPIFVLLPRGPRGGLTREARDQAKQLAPNGFEFKLGKSAEKNILQELQDLLPKNVLLSKSNPFAVLKLTPTAGALAGSCLCKCGASMNCGGGGGGGALV